MLFAKLNSRYSWGKQKNTRKSFKNVKKCEKTRKCCSKVDILKQKAKIFFEEKCFTSNSATQNDKKHSKTLLKTLLLKGISF